MKKFDFKLPDMTLVKPRLNYARSAPPGEFRMEVVRIRPQKNLNNSTAIIAECRILEIVNQRPAVDRKTEQQLPAVVVGERVDIYMALGQQWEYGEKEWAGLMLALGVPVEEQNATQEAFLGDENLAQGLQFWVRREPPKTLFFPVKKAA